MPTTGGALAFRNLRPPYEATLTRQLREAGAIIIAKTTLTELANWVRRACPPATTPSPATASTRTTSPRIRRGTFEAARPAAGRLQLRHRHRGQFLGRQRRHGNVRVDPQPVQPNMLAGIKPTVGRVSRHGVIPITADQDTPGPMARSVADAAILLGALEGAAPDPNDPATRACSRRQPRLHAVPSSRRAEGRAHRRAARVQRAVDPGSRDRLAGSPQR